MAEKRKRGRPRNTALDALQEELSISRRHARNLLDEQRKSGSGISVKASPLAQARLTKTLREIEVLEAKVRTLRLQERELSGELLYREEAQAILVAGTGAIVRELQTLPKNLSPRLYNQPQKAIERTLSEFADRVQALAERAVAACTTPHTL